MRSPDGGCNWGIHSPARPYFRVTVDDIVDLEVVRKVVADLYQKNPFFGVDDVVDYLTSHPDVAGQNMTTVRNEGFLKSLEEDKLTMNSTHGLDSDAQGQKLWKRAKKLIPGGNMLLSKRPEMFLPDFWPAYFSRKKVATYGILMEISIST